MTTFKARPVTPPPPLPPPPAPLPPASPQQGAIATAVLALAPGECVCAVARAGTGKSFTLLNTIRSLPAGARVLLLVFTKAGERDLKERMGALPPGGPRVEVRTIDAWAMNVHGRASDLEYGKLGRLLADAVSPAHVKDRRLWRVLFDLVEKGVALCVGLPGGPPLVPSTFWDIVRDYALLLPKGVPVDRVTAAAVALFRASERDDRGLTFGDYTYRLARDGLPAAVKYDYVLVDEVQDVSAVQFRLLDALVERGARLVLAGDDKQALYAFRAAHVDGMHEAIRRYKAKTYPITVTRRCPRAVVAEAQRLVPDLQALDDAPEGEVLTLAPEGLLDALKAAAGGEFGTTAVVARNNAPLLRAALAAVRAGVRVYVRGLGSGLAKDVGATLTAIFDRKGAPRWNDATAWTSAIAAAKAENADRPFVAAKAVERLEVARTFWEHAIALGARCFADVLEGVGAVVAKYLAEDGGAAAGGPAAITFSTGHGAKGLEWDNVFFLAPEGIPGKLAQRAGGWHLVQERNLFYVMVTRAKKRLIYVTEHEDPISRVEGTEAP